MKGAKGGKRDKIISRLFSNKNKKIKTEAEEQVKAADKKIIVPFTKQKNHPDKQDIEIEIQDVIPPATLDETMSQKHTFLTKEKTQSKDETTIILGTETKEQKEEIQDITIEPEDVKKIIPEEVVTVEDEKESSELEEALESKILDALETIIKQDLYELEEIEYEFKVLNDTQEAEVDFDEIEKLKAELEELQRKFEIIKSKYDQYKNSDKIYDIDIDDKFIYDLVVEYKKEARDNTLIEKINDQVEKIDEYLGVIEKILNVEKAANELGEEIDEKLENFEMRDEEFEKMKIEYENIEDINDLIETFNRKQDDIIKDLEYKIKTSEEITRKVEIITNYSTNINRLIQMALLISISRKIPPTPTGNILKTTLMISAIDAAAHFVTKQESSKLITRVKYTDYSNSIKKAAYDTRSIIAKIDDAFLDIEKIRAIFEKECIQYRDQIDEYDQLMKNLDRVEKELKAKKEIAKKYNKNFEKILQANNQKVKRLEELKAS